jgi:hypothetical protein
LKRCGQTAEPKGKLDAMLYGHHGGRGDGERTGGRAPRLDAIDWRTCEEEVRRLRQRIFSGAGAGLDLKGPNLQKLTAPRGALSYPRLSREEFEGRFLGLMPYLELKGEGNHSMAGN